MVERDMAKGAEDVSKKLELDDVCTDVGNNVTVDALVGRGGREVLGGK